MVDHRLHVGVHAAAELVLEVVALGALEADGDLQVFAGFGAHFGAHLARAAGALHLEVERVDQAAVDREELARAHRGEQRLRVLDVAPEVVPGVLAGRVAAAVQAFRGREVVVGIGHVPDAAALGQQGVPGAAELGDEVVDAAVGARGQVGRRVVAGVAAAVGLHLVADHALEQERDVGRGVVHLAQLGGRVLAGVARGVVDLQVAGIGVVLLEPGDGLEHVFVRGEGACVLGAPRGHVGGREQRGVAVGEQVFELAHGLERRVGHGAVGQDADVAVVVRGHVPLEGREDRLVGVLAAGLQRLDARHLVEGHASRERNRWVQLAAVVVIGRHAQVVRQRDPVEAEGVEGLGEHLVERGNLLRVLRLDGVDVQVAHGPAAGGLGRGRRRGGRGRRCRGRRCDGQAGERRTAAGAAAAGGQQGRAERERREKRGAKAGCGRQDFHGDTSSNGQRMAGRRIGISTRRMA
ncbi:hypothetical protein D3C86_651100 [compost metagenome]